MGQNYHLRHAETWASQVTYCAVLVTFLTSLVWISWIHCAESAAKKKLNLKLESSIQGQFLKYVDENWGGSLKFRLLSRVTSPNFSGDCRSSMYVALTLY